MWGKRALRKLHNVCRIQPCHDGMSGCFMGAFTRDGGSITVPITVPAPDMITAVYIGSPPRCRPPSGETLVHCWTPLEKFSYDVPPDPEQAAALDAVVMYVHECQQRKRDERETLAAAPTTASLQERAEEIIRWLGIRGTSLTFDGSTPQLSTSTPLRAVLLILCVVV